MTPSSTRRAMKERGFVALAHEVRAIIDGRQSQFTRLVKPLGDGEEFNPGEGWRIRAVDGAAVASGAAYIEETWEPAILYRRCPYGAPGDRLWVRETWAETIDTNDLRHSGEWPDRPHIQVEGQADDVVIYRADGEWTWVDDDGGETNATSWRPSIHMPRWASRLTLEVTDVRVQRLQEISEEDARAEGCTPEPGWAGEPPAADVFEALWDAINGKRAPWASNPWVWAVTFGVLEPRP